MSIYEERGMSLGQPGSAEWILRQGLKDTWMLEHAFLCLAYLERYQQLYPETDVNLVVEATSLREIIDLLTEHPNYEMIRRSYSQLPTGNTLERVAAQAEAN